MIVREIPRNTASLKLFRFHEWIIGAAPVTSEMFPHTSPPKRVSAIFQMWFGFSFYSLLNFDIVNADVTFYKREMEAKLNKARHAFSKEISLNMAADFQLIPSEDVPKRTKNFHPHMQSYFGKKTH